ncbi:MAG: hypothetical protein JJ958_12970 [Balneola sp.]|nr:hypothetical protein [Balneola sp.]
MPSQEKLKIKFGGKANTVNATTYLNSLSSFVTIAEEVNKNLNNQEKISINIQAHKPGSFEVFLELVTSAYDTVDVMFNTGVTNAGDLFKIITGVYTVRKFLSGKKPKKIDEVEAGINITNSKGNTITVNKNTYNIYNSNFSVIEALNNNFESLNNDSSVDSFEIYEKGNKPVFKSDKSDFGFLTDQELEEIQADEKYVTTRHSIRVFKVVFEKKYTWQFIHKGEKINAKILDEKFLKGIESGTERFGKGDILEVELEVLKKYDESLGAFINSKYSVKKVFNHIPRSSQGELNL